MRTTSVGDLGRGLVTDLQPSMHLPTQASPAEGGDYLDQKIYLALLSPSLYFYGAPKLIKRQYTQQK